MNNNGTNDQPNDNVNDNTNDNDVLKRMMMYKENNYMNIYKEDCLVDYCANKKMGWRVGKIKMLSNDLAFIEDCYSSSSSNTNEYIELKVSNSNSVSYFTKHTSNNKYTIHIKPTSNQLDKLLKWFTDNLITNYSLQNNDTMRNENSYEILCTIKGYFYQYTQIYIFPTDYTSYDKKDAEKLLQCIQYIIQYVFTLLKFINNNIDTLIEYEKIKHTDQIDKILFNWKLAVVSVYPEIQSILIKLFGHDEYFKTYCDTIEWYNNILNNDKYRESTCVLNFLCTERICIDQAYNKEQRIGTKMKNIPSCPLAKFIDYFYQLGGFTVVHDIIKNGNSSNISIIFLNRIISIYEAVSLITNQFAKKGSNEVNAIKDILISRLEHLDEKEIKDYTKEVIESVIRKVANMLPSLNNENKKYNDLCILTYYYRCYMCNNLDSKLSGLKGFNTIINSVASQINNTLKYNEECSNECNEFYLMKDPMFVVKFFDEKKVIDSFFEEEVHEEISKRSLRVIKFMHYYKWNMKASDDDKIHQRTLNVCERVWEKGCYKTTQGELCMFEWFKVYLCDLLNEMKSVYKEFFYNKLKDYINDRGYVKEDLTYLLEFTKCNLDRDYEEEAMKINGNNRVDYQFHDIPVDMYGCYIKKCKLYGLEIFWEMLHGNEEEDNDNGNDNSNNEGGGNSNNNNAIEVSDIQKVNEINTTTTTTTTTTVITTTQEETTTTTITTTDNASKDNNNTSPPIINNNNNNNNILSPTTNNNKQRKLPTLTKDIIKTCVESISDIINNPKIIDRTRLIFLHKCFTYISHNKPPYLPITHILLHNLFTSKIPFFTKYDSLLQQLNHHINIITIITTNFIDYMNTNTSNPSSIQTNQLYTHKDHIYYRINVIGFLINSKLNFTWSETTFKPLWSTCTVDPIARDEMYSMLSKHISQVNTNILEIILNEVLSKDKECIITDMNSYTLLKQAIYEINKRQNVFYFYYTDKQHLRINNPSNIIGIEKLWELLLNTTIPIQVKDEISSLLCDICLNQKSFKSNETALIAFWKGYIHKAITILNDSINNKNDNGIESVLMLIKKICQHTGEDGNISAKKLSECNNTINPKGSSTYFFKTLNNSDLQGVKVGNDELFYILRDKLSYMFNIPKNKVLIEVSYKKTYYNASSSSSSIVTKCFDMNNDLDETNALIHETNNSVDYYSSMNFINEIIVKEDKHPILKLSTNPKNILLEESFDDILSSLLKEPNKPYINEVWDLIKQLYSNTHQSLNITLIPLLSEIGNDINMVNDINMNYNFDNYGTYYCSFKLCEIKSTLFEYTKEQNDFMNMFISGYLWKNKLKPLFQVFKISNTININEKLESFNCVKYLIEIYNEVYKRTNKTENDKRIIIPQLINHLHYIMKLFTEEENTLIYSTQLKDNVYDLQCVIMNILNGKEEVEWVINEIKDNSKDDMVTPSATPQEDRLKDIEDIIVFILQNCLIKGTYNKLKHKVVDWVYNVFDYYQSNYDTKKEMFVNVNTSYVVKLSKLSNAVVNCLLSKEHLLTISNKVNDVQCCNSNSNQIIPHDVVANVSKYFQMISTLIHKTFPYLHHSKYEFDYNTFINKFILIEITKKPFIHELILSGYLKIILSIIKHNDIVFDDIVLSDTNNDTKHTTTINFASFIYEHLLFSKCRHNPLTKPTERCSLYSSTFQSAFHLLTYLSFNNPTFRANIMTDLTEYHNKQFWKKTNSWSIIPNETRITPYIGIRNLGCTCYINSLFQIFYSIPQLRQGILNCECEVNEKNSLYQLKKIFYTLTYSESSYCSTEDFCNNFDNDKLKTGEQMDIDEFFNTLLDRMERHLKPTSNADLVKYFFEGRNSDDLIFTCGHKRSNEFSFYSTQLQVKGKKSLEESLTAIIEGEVMDGANKIICETCNDKKSTTKRQTFKVLPRILLFVLKRFEYDYARGVKIKVNDYYEFPIELDMTPYTLDYVNKGEGNECEKHLYKLKGIVIHMGNSEGGHYYDYIRDSITNEWYEFNDIQISKYDIKNVKEDAFGGFENVSGVGKNKIERDRNAYLLFYEKVNTINNGNNSSDSDMKVNISSTLFNSSNIMNSINEDVQMFYINKIIFSETYQMFILEFILNVLCTSYSKPNEVLLLFKFLNRTKNTEQEHYQTHRNNFPYIGITILDYIINNKIHRFNFTSHEEGGLPLVIKCFEFLMIYFFQVFIRTKHISSYLIGYIDLFKFFINHSVECAEMFIKELTNKKAILEYITTCPKENIKKLIIGLIKTAMIRLQDKQTEDESKRPRQKVYLFGPITVSNLNEGSTSIKESNRKDYTEITRKYVSNIIHILNIIRNDKQRNFIWATLNDFAKINHNNKMYLIKEKKILEYLYYLVLEKTNSETKPHNIKAKLDDALSEAATNYKEVNTHLLKMKSEYESNLFIFDTSSSYELKENYAFLLLCTLLTNQYDYPLKHITSLKDLITLMLCNCSHSIQNQHAVSDYINFITLLDKNINDVIITNIIDMFNNYPFHKVKFLLLITRNLLLSNMKDEYWEKKAKRLIKHYFTFIQGKTNRYGDRDEVAVFLIDLFLYHQDKLQPLLPQFKSSFKDLVNSFYNEILSKTECKGKGEFAFDKIKEKKEKLQTLLNGVGYKLDSKLKLNDIKVFNFPFSVNDVVLYDNKEYVVTEAQDEFMLIEEKRADNERREVKIIETDDEKIQIKKINLSYNDYSQFNM